MKYIIGTRGSKLALVQSEGIRKSLEEMYPMHSFELKIIKTTGDVNQKDSLYKIGGKGVFVQEIEEQLLSGDIHMAVHSMKDMPSIPAKGCMFTKNPKREDPRDVLVLREKKSLSELPNGATIATGSVRRQACLLNIRPDLKIVDIRGNVDTRLKKMEELKLDGIVLAAAGLKRLHHEDKITQYLSYDEMIPSPAQGCLALEINEKNMELKDMLDALSDEESTQTASIERLFLAKLQADCSTPVGAICEKKENMYTLRVALEKNGELDVVYVEGTDGETMVNEAISKLKKGKVYLVGAGCGDKDLITVKGLKCIQNADCIVYDRLIDPSLLEEAKEGCDLVYVGKENKHHIMPQNEINALLVRKALIHGNVVRLKGGDSFVFGRGGEEIEELMEHGIEFEVVPGITSSIAGLTSAGIPITHRDFVSGFRVITAHNRNGNMDHIDFLSIAKGNETTVFLMGLSKLDQIVESLIQAGMDKDMDIVVIGHAYMADQINVQGTLENIVDRVKEAHVVSPGIIAIGKTIAFRNKYKKFLVTKVGDKSELATLLKNKGYQVDELCLGKIKYLDFDMEGKYSYIIFTSKNGVDSFFEKEMDISDTKFISIGQKTANYLKGKGYDSYFVSKGNSEDLVKDIKKYINKDDRLLYVRAKEVSSDLSEKLSGYCKIDDVVAYENEEVYPSYVDVNQYDGIFFTCASSVKRFMKTYNPECDLYSMGPCTSKEIKKFGKVPKEAKTPSIEEMVKLV